MFFFVVFFNQTINDNIDWESNNLYYTFCSDLALILSYHFHPNYIYHVCGESLLIWRVIMWQIVFVANRFNTTIQPLLVQFCWFIKINTGLASH